MRCGSCGASRPADLAKAGPRTPCPECGETAINVAVALTETLSLTDNVSATMTPADQSRDWKRRWREIERELSALGQSRDGSMSAEAIHQARHRLHSFFIQAYHLKDALNVEQSNTGIPASTVEAAISAEPALALLADLANLDKHGALSRPPRSGAVPTIASASATSENAAGPGWRLNLVIEHSGRRLDGLAAATDAVDAWKRVLTSWGLL